MDDAKISGKVVYDDIWVGITTSADDEKGTISNESVKMYAKSTKSSTTDVSYRITCNNGNQRTLRNP